MADSSWEDITIDHTVTSILNKLEHLYVCEGWKSKTQMQYIRIWICDPELYTGNVTDQL